MSFHDIQQINNSAQNESAARYPALQEAIENYIVNIREEYGNMNAKQARDTLLSEYNYQMRSHLKSSRSFGLNIEAGDICYIDYGRAYISEIGYQHFGLVLKVFCGKAFVLPMTSNENNYSLAYDPVSNPDGLRHLMRLGKVEGLYRYSVLFLNDGKFINTARIIDIKGHIDPQGELFERIRNRFISCLE